MAWHDALSKKHQTRKANRFNNIAQKSVDPVSGRSFDSKFESELYGQLLWLQKAGLINNIRCQVSIQITPHVKWKADFVAFDIKTQKDVAHEAKGFEGDRWLVIRQLLKDLAPMDVCIYKKKGNTIVMTEEIKAK